MKLVTMTKRLADVLSNPISTVAFRAIVIVGGFILTALVWGLTTWLNQNYARRQDIDSLVNIPNKLAEVQKFVIDQARANEVASKQGLEQLSFTTEVRRSIAALQATDGELRAQINETKASTQSVKEQLIRMEVQQAEITKQLDRVITRLDRVGEKIGVRPP